ncbi:response regulator transcription factor [Candidatus Woesearchaeota archaeon]|nr:response regulator transcription factor [Candidatus Woesearchaeota archaeon]
MERRGNLFGPSNHTDSEIHSLKEELNKQDRWIKHLHEYSRDLHKFASDIKHSNTKHKKEILDSLTNLSSWIDYLNNSHNKMKHEINELRNSLKRSLKNDFQAYHHTFSEYINLKLNQARQENEALKKELLEKIESRPEPVSNILMRDTDFNNHDLPVHTTPAVELTNPETELLNLLFNANGPMTYQDIADKLKKSINSVRVYMNSLKSKKNIIDEFTTASGSKIFSIKNSELVKTLYNLN